MEREKGEIVIEATEGAITAGLLGVDVSDIFADGAGDEGRRVQDRRLEEIERRVLALEELGGAVSGMIWPTGK